MSAPTLLVDGRVLDEQHPGVAHYWIPVLTAWAARGGRGALVHHPGRAPDARLLAAGFSALAFAARPRDPLALARTRRFVRATGAVATLSPLYLTLDGAPRNLATVFDLTGRTQPRTIGAQLTWELAIRWTLRRASAVICATAAAARSLEAAFPSARGRTAVVPAVAPGPPRHNPAVLARYGLAPPFALAIASHRPHKRLAELTRAWRAAGSAMPLVLAGHGTERLNDPPNVLGLGFIGDVDLDAILAAAGCLISASVAEGFGLPVLAAMGAGVPVAASRLPALEEIAGNAAAWLPPDRLDDLVAAAISLASDLTAARDRVAHGRERAQAFTPACAAAALRKAIDPTRGVLGDW